MGVILSRWRKKETTIETLEKLEKEITAIESQRKSNQESERRIVGSLILYSASLYIVFTAIFYFYYLPEKWVERIKYSVPLIAFPLIIWSLKRFLHWYFVKRITKNETKLEMFIEQKKVILNDVMEKETYKKAKEILERFDSTKKLQDLQPAATPAPQKFPDGQDLRRRVMDTPQVGQTPGGSVPMTPGPLAGVAAVSTPQQSLTSSQPTPGTAVRPTPGMNMGQQAPQWGTPMRVPGPPMARPILPRERTAGDRILEYLIGDGPQNRYALICKQCFSHNGMAYKEEFDYLNFRCCYCYTFNKARKQRPNAPNLVKETPPVVRRTLDVNQLEPESGTDAECDSDDTSSRKLPENIPSEPKKDK